MFRSYLRSFALRASKSGALLLVLIGTALVGTALAWVLPGARVEALDATASVTDSVVVYGPRRFDASGSGTAINLERLSFPRVAGRRYIVRVENGAADGSGRVTQGSVKLNGWQIVAGTELTAGVAKLERPGVFRGSDTTVVSLDGALGSFVTLSVLSVADPSTAFFGPVQYTIIQGTAKDHDTTFTAPANGGPWTLTVLNGDSLGVHRTSSATLTLNGVSILTPNNFNQNVGSLSRSVTLQASNFLHVRLPGEPEGFVIIRITGTDNVPPVLTVTAPANNFLTRDTIVTVTGTVQDQTQVQVTVNGVIAAVAGNGGWSASVPLTVEGANTLAITALDANGLHTDSSRVVKRDTHVPVLSVTSPAVDGYTHDTVVVVTGSATDASHFFVNLNGTPLAVDSLGHFADTLALTEGVNALVVTATDAVGNAATVARTLRRDTHAPMLAVTTPAGTVYSRDTVYTVSGSATDAGPVSVTVNGFPVTLDSAGAWSRAVDLVVEGMNVVTVRATDASGLQSTEVRTIFRDTHAPALVVTSPQPSVYSHDTSFVVTGTLSDASPVTLTVNGVTVVPDSAGNWSQVASLTVEGANVLTAVATDAAGGVSTVTRTITRDTQAPALVVTAPIGTVYSRDTVHTISGTVTDGSALTVTVNGVLVTTDSTGNWSQLASLTVEGANLITVVATDASGLATTVTRTVIRDTHAPALAITAPQASAYSHDTTFLVTGTLSDASPIGLTVNGATVTADSAGNWSLVVGLATEGSNVITAVATDAAGGVSTVTRTITRDTQAPVLVVDAPQPTAYSRDTTVIVSGSATDAAALTLTVNGVAVVPDSTGHWSAVASLAVEGANGITVVATDAAGLSTTVTRTVVRDTHAPTLVITTPTSGVLTQSGTVTISGTLADSTPVTLTVNGQPVAVLVTGGWSLVASLAEGANLLTAQATDAAGNVSTASVSVTRDSQAPVITLQSPDDGSTTTDSSVTVSGTVTDASGNASVTVNGNVVTVTGGAFSKSVALIIGANTLTVSATDAAGNVSSVSRSVTRTPAGPQLPPDPATVAPALDQTVATNTFTSTQFLYTGTNPIQTGVFPGTITLTRAAVVRGTVISRDGTPLGGVAVSLRGRPEYGQTLSRADGQFDFALNGGGPMIFDYAKEGYLPAQRSITAEWQAWTVADTVALVPLDTVVTHITFTQPIEVARGSVVTDSVGTRQGTLMFKQGTTATMVLPNGTTQPLSALDVRVSEFTVGSNGQAAMPGELPPATAYTYAAELSVDAALAAGATSVTFSQPVNYYLDNFRNLPVGAIIPAGYYDRAAGIWRPEPDGRVIKIVAINGGVADISVDPNQLAASQAVLDSLGITTAERTKLATLYPVGKTLWWTSLSHFSGWDLNLGWHFVGFIAGPVPYPLFIRDPAMKPCECGGSIISVENQTLGENLPLAGTPYALHYESHGALGYGVGRSITIPAVTAVDTMPLILGTRWLLRNEAPTSLLWVDYYLTVAGRRYARGPFSVFNIPQTTFIWDGKDAAGRYVMGTQKAQLEIVYWYRAARGYFNANGAGQGRRFGSPGGLGGATVGGTFPMPLSTTITVEMGTREARGAGFGGWTLNAHHEYNPVSGELVMGDGHRRTATAIGARVRKLLTGLSNQTGAVTGPDGMIYTSHSFNFNNRILRWDPTTGASTTFAGKTSPAFGFTGDGGLATQASLNNPAGMAISPDGTLYFADKGNHRIRRVRADGIIETIAGTGVDSYSGDGGPATAATFHNIIGVAYGPDGSLFVSDDTTSGATRIRRIAPDGSITRYAGGTSFTGYPVDSTLAVGASFGWGAVDHTLAMGPDGSLYFATKQTDEFNNTAGLNVIFRIDQSGRLWRVAGRKVTEAITGLSPARQLLLRGPVNGLTFDREGRLLFTYAATIYRVDLSGNYEIIAGVGHARCVAPTGCFPLTEPNNTAAVATPLEGVAYLTTLPDRRVAFADGASVKVVEPPLPNLGATELLAASEDGSQVYQFNQFGRHLRTLDALTRDTLLEFGYDAAGLVTSVTDADGLVTTFQRSNGVLTSVTGPYGQQTAVTNDANGYLHTLTDPAGETVTLTTSATGLLQGLRRSGEGAHAFGYDVLGRLTSDADPSGRVQTLSHAETDTSATVILNSGLGRRLTIRVDQLIANRRRTTSTDPAGLSTVSTAFENDSTVTVTSDGTTKMSVRGSDTRFGPQSLVLRKAVTTLPSGLTSTLAASRTATLTNSNDPFTLTSLLDSLSVNGRLFRSLYTRSTRTAISTSPMGRTSTTIYDASGRLVQSSVPGIDAALFTYDAQGRLQQAKSGGRVSSFAYGANGRLLSTTDPLGRKDSLFYDARDRLTRHRLLDGREVAFTYDSAGNLTSITPPGRLAHGMTYDSAGRMTEYAPPSAGLPTSGTSYDYNTAKQVTAIHRPDGLTVGFGYDTAGRPSTVSFDRGQIAFGYSPSSGNLTTLTAPGGNGLAFTYDGSLPTSVTWSGAVSGSTAVSYNSNFQVTNQTVNGGNAVSYGYDLDGLLTQAGALGLRRDATNGRLVADSVGGQKTTYAYDSHGALLGLVSSVGTDTQLVTAYVRDSLSRITRLVEKIQGVTHDARFTYDTAGRLNTVTRDGVLATTYSYDSNGNRLAKVAPGVSETGVYDDQDRMTSYDAASYTYGANGELQTKILGSDTTRYTYDALSNLTHVGLPTGTAIDYVIDAQNRRIGKKVNGVLTTGWLYHGQLTPVAELDGAGNVTARFVYATGINAPDLMVKGGVTYRFIRDHLGSVRLVVDVATGTVAQRIDYDEFGVETQNTNPGFQPFGYAGGLTEGSTGLVRFGSRDYDPARGRWSAKDPAQFVGGDANMYQYVHGDPVNCIDPTGFVSWTQTGYGVFAIGVGALGVGAAATAATPFLAVAFGVGGVMGIALGGLQVALGLTDRAAEDGRKHNFENFPADAFSMLGWLGDRIADPALGENQVGNGQYFGGLGDMMLTVMDAPTYFRDGMRALTKWFSWCPVTFPGI